jgi:hypothetical protein
MPINMFFIVKNHWEPYFMDNLCTSACMRTLSGRCSRVVETTMCFKLAGRKPVFRHKERGSDPSTLSSAEVRSVKSLASVSHLAFC